MLQVILNIMHGSGMVKSLGDVTGDSEHYMDQEWRYIWMLLQVILNIMYGLGMEVPLGVVTGDSERYVWCRNVSAIGCCYG